MSDVVSKATSDTALAIKRRTSFTVKGMMFFMQTCQEKRSKKCRQAKLFMNQMDELMHSADNIDVVKSLLGQMMTCVNEAKQHHLSFVSLNIPQDEKERQNTYCEQRKNCFQTLLMMSKGGYQIQAIYMNFQLNRLIIKLILGLRTVYPIKVLQHAQKLALNCQELHLVHLQKY